jgi:hypothetical protein
MTFTIERPAASEHAPAYAPYIAKIPAGDILDILEQQRLEAVKFFASVPEEGGTYRYQPGKWSVVDVMQHLIDAERIFSTRALRIGRGDKTPMPGWDENEYAAMAGADGRDPSDLAQEFDLVRRGTLALIRSFDPEAIERRGTANNFEVTVRALVYIMAGHVAHHLGVLRERYHIGG